MCSLLLIHLTKTKYRAQATRSVMIIITQCCLIIRNDTLLQYDGVFIFITYFMPSFFYLLLLVWMSKLLLVLACQCNGHSTCNSLDECISCSDNTTGSNCQTCMDGLFGDPSNGGTCQSKSTPHDTPPLCRCSWRCSSLELSPLYIIWLTLAACSSSQSLNTPTVESCISKINVVPF